MFQGKVIAVVGLPGSGKTEAIEYLQEKFGWPKVYFGEPTFDEMKRRGMELTQANEKIVREDLRKNFGVRYYSGEVIKKIEALENVKVMLAESLYMWEEYKHFKEKFGEKLFVLAVYAPPKLRYERLKNRPKRPLTLEEAQDRDFSQIEVLTQGGPIAMADGLVKNEGTVEEMHSAIDQIINKLIQI